MNKNPLLDVSKRDVIYPYLHLPENKFGLLTADTLYIAGMAPYEFAVKGDILFSNDNWWSAVLDKNSKRGRVSWHLTWKYHEFRPTPDIVKTLRLIYL